jgi:hypothetical protein
MADLTMAIIALAYLYALCAVISIFCPLSFAATKHESFVLCFFGHSDFLKVVWPLIQCRFGDVIELIEF